MQKYIGPVKIAKRIGSVAYKVKLSPNMKMHPVFHVSLLKPYHEGMGESVLEETLRSKAPRTSLDQVGEDVTGCPQDSPRRAHR